MTNIHFSDFDNKNLPNPYVLKFPSKLLLEKRMFTLTYVDFDMKPVFLFGNLN